jgi:hypothetical protein
MRLKTTELEGNNLDKAVAVALRLSVKLNIDGGVSINTLKYPEYAKLFPGFRFAAFRPSTDWSQGGVILQRECMELHVEDPSEWHASMWWDDENSSGDIRMRGPTPLIAVCRCVVAAVLGDEVEIPEELA